MRHPGKQLSLAFVQLGMEQRQGWTHLATAGRPFVAIRGAAAFTLGGSPEVAWGLWWMGSGGKRNAPWYGRFGCNGTCADELGGAALVIQHAHQNAMTSCEI